MARPLYHHADLVGVFVDSAADVAGFVRQELAPRIAYASGPARPKPAGGPAAPSSDPEVEISAGGSDVAPGGAPEADARVRAPKRKKKQRKLGSAAPAMVPYPPPPERVRAFCASALSAHWASSWGALVQVHTGPQADTATGESGATAIDFVAAADAVREARRTEPSPPADAGGDADASAAVDGLFENSGASDLVCSLFGARFALPQRSGFVLGDAFDADLLLRAAKPPGGARVLLMDPPWENKSVARGRQYRTEPHRRLLDLPVPLLASGAGCLVAVWVTNRPLYHAFLLEEVFPRWGASHWGTWHWLKVGSDGAPIYPIDAAHRRPYEPLFIAVVPGRDSESRTPALPPDLVLCSVPTGHSRKPPIHGLLEGLAAGLLGEGEGGYVELFARSLRAGWRAVGNEAPLFCRLPP